MKKHHLPILLIISCLFVVLIASKSYGNYAPGEIILKFASDDIYSINAFINQSGAYSYERVFHFTDLHRKSGLTRIYKLKFPPNADIPSIISRNRDNLAIEYIQPNYLYQSFAKEIEPNDYFYSEQWALKKVNAPGAWEIERGSDDIVIAVVDTGVDYKHEDLASRIWQNVNEIPNNGVDDDENGYIDDIRGWDFYDSHSIPSDGDYIDRDNDPMDEKGHGTVVAGIIGAVPDNSIGISGVVWDCRIMPLRAGNKYFEDDDLCSAIVYAADNGANIINMSWGGDEFSYVIRDATKYAYDRGCVLVAAAGNDNQQKLIYPAIFEHVIGVGATDKNDKKASFSNYGAGIDIVAPGDRVFGTVPNNQYSNWSGTSMAAPVVSGIVTLMLSKRPSLNNRDIPQILSASADKMDEPLFAGIGRINAEKALLTGVNLTAHINSPHGGEGADKQFIIAGTASGKDFKNYQLEYTEPSAPDDWRRIGNPGNDTKFDDVLGVWDVSRLAEGNYILRLNVSGYGDLSAEDRISLNVDHSPPKLTKFGSSSRLNGSRAGSVITLITDDLTRIDLHYRRVQTTSFQSVSLPVMYREHEIGISDYLEPGLYECFLTITNSAELTSTDDNKGGYYSFEAQSYYPPIDGFIEMDSGISAMYPVSANVDFDGDGKSEIIGMDQPVWDYATVRIYEKDGGKYGEVYKSEDEYFPRDVADSDKDGLWEILGNRKETTFLMESPKQGEYPTEIVWAVEGLWGGQFADTDMDGNIEILASDISNTTIDIYENRGNDSYLRTTRLANPTEGINHLAISFAAADFDTDGRTEIIGGDLDGEIFAYKNIGDDAYEVIWTGKIPDSYIKTIIHGDFDGDGSPEFAVASKTADTADRASKLFVLTIFDWLGNDFRAIWSTQIASSQETIGLTAGDLDNDGMDELVATVSPATYIFKYSLNPSCVWYHPASSTYNPLIQDIDGDGFKELMFNVDKQLMFYTTMQGEGVRKPWGVKAAPSGESEIEIRWNALSSAEAYRIYRGTRINNLHAIATLGLSTSFQGANRRVFRDDNYVDSGYYRDNDVSVNIELWYAIVAINPDGRESPFSEIVSAKPNSAPQLQTAVYARPSSLYVYFNEPMGGSAKNESNYLVKSSEGQKYTPSSAILDQGDMRVVLTLSPLPNGINTLNVSGIRDATGIPINDSLMLFFVSIDSQSQYNNLDFVKLYPNPILLKESRKVTFCCLPTGARISIFDINGRLVNRLPVEESDKGSKIWGLDNEQGYDVSSGIYIYAVEFSSQRRTGKIAVIK